MVISTGGGLYRYQLHDLIQVVGYLGTCPLLKFVGKESYISDWFGEKLNERHVRQTLDQVQKGLARAAPISVSWTKRGTGITIVATKVKNTYFRRTPGSTYSTVPRRTGQSISVRQET